MARSPFFIAAAAAAVGVGVVVVLSGPFPDLQRSLGVSDAIVHAVIFYFATLALFIAAPQNRRVDLALVMLLLALGIELGRQALGGAMAPENLAASVFGVLAAVLPGLLERVRFAMRRRQTGSRNAAHEARQKEMLEAMRFDASIQPDRPASIRAGAPEGQAAPNDLHFSGDQSPGGVTSDARLIVGHPAIGHSA
jgi:hypothetical protein